MNNNKFDLTEGSILKKLLLVALPIMATQLVQMTYNLTDIFWLGKLSTGAVAASGSAGMFLWLSMAFLLIGRMGAEIGVSQRLGAKDYENAKGYSTSAVFVAAVLGVIYGLILILFSRPLIGIFNIQEQQVVKDASDYLVIVGIGIPFTYISGAIMGTINGAGNSRLSFVCNLAGLVTNMILDPLMIFTFKMGIHGAAVATVIAQGFVCILFVLSIKFNKSRPFEKYRFFVKPELEKLSHIFRWSIPIALESMLFTIFAMITSRFVAAFGTNAISAHKIGAQIESLSWLIGGGFGTAVTTFVGQNYGAGKWTRIHRCVKISSAAMITWGIIISSILLLFGRQLFTVFLNEPATADIGENYLNILAACQVATCMEAVIMGAFMGTGDSVPPSVSSIISNVIRVPLAYFLSRTALGLNGIWWTISITAIFRLTMMLIWYLKKQRQRPKEDIPLEPQPLF